MGRKPILLVVDVQNGFLNENTDYLPSAIADFIRHNKDSFQEVVILKLVGNGLGHYPSERDGKAGGFNTLKTSHGNSIVPPLRKLSDRVLSHTCSTDMKWLDNIDADSSLYLTGYETDTTLLPMAALLRNLNRDVKVLFDLTATTIGEGTQMMMHPILVHLLGSSNVLHSKIPSEHERAVPVREG